MKMGKHKLRKRLCVSYAKFKRFLKPRPLSPDSPTHNTETPFGFTRIFSPPQKDETWERVVNVAIRDKDDSPWSGFNHGIVLFDTQSRYNLVSSQFLRDIGVEWKQSPDNANIVQMDDTRVKCLGEIQGRWRVVETEKKDLNFRPRFEISTFKVVELPTFDLIIGRKTMEDLDIVLVNRNYLGAFRPVPIRVDSASTLLKKQREVEERRKKEQEEMKKYEEEQERKAKATKTRSS